ncbi:ferritin-like domain-containing protein [Sorangium sp. So ce136]|uniref:ferritin-like domain-containing protein n=1 Tax=Sorangium sp. So ce136 TaxID=3133284 RepID=UPI003F0D036D
MWSDTDIQDDNNLMLMLRQNIENACREEESVRMLRAHVRAAEEPSIRRVFESLLRDEVRHAAAGHRRGRPASPSL